MTVPFVVPVVTTELVCRIRDHMHARSVDVYGIVGVEWEPTRAVVTGYQRKDTEESVFEITIEDVKTPAESFKIITMEVC